MKKKNVKAIGLSILMTLGLALVSAQCSNDPGEIGMSGMEDPQDTTQVDVIPDTTVDESDSTQRNEEINETEEEVEL